MIALTSAVLAVYVLILVVIGRATVRGLRAALDDAAVRWGELLGPAEPGRPKADAETSLTSEDSLGRMDRHRFRQLAANADAVCDEPARHSAPPEGRSAGKFRNRQAVHLAGESTFSPLGFLRGPPGGRELTLVAQEEL